MNIVKNWNRSHFYYRSQEYTTVLILDWKAPVADDHQYFLSLLTLPPMQKQEFFFMSARRFGAVTSIAGIVTIVIL